MSVRLPLLLEEDTGPSGDLLIEVCQAVDLALLQTLQEAVKILQLERLASLMASAPAFRITVVSSGFEEHKEWLNFLVSVLNLIATISIPLLLWWYGKQQEKQQQQQAAQQRLQGHVGQLSSAGGAAIEVIGSFKDDCKSLGVPYTDVFRFKSLLVGPAAAITTQQLQEVDRARRILQGIWDNIMDDYRADMLGGPITDPRHGRMLRRGLTYMELVEPLEAANFARLQAVNSRVASEGLYVRRAPPATTGQHAAHAQQSSIVRDAAIMGRPGARPSRFRWLENQRTLQLTGKELWKIETVHNVKEYCVDAAAAVLLEAGGSAERQAWGKALVRNWAALQQACTPLTPPATSATAAAAAASGPQVQVVTHTPAAP